MVAGYVRVSTEDQVQNGGGLDVQKDEIRRLCEREGLALSRIYEDPGVSGSTLERPALQEMLRDAAAGAFDTVVVQKLDRLSRDLMGQLWIEKELLKHRVALMSVAEPMRGNDPAATLMRQIIGAFAEFERSRITERMVAGRLQKAARGGYAGSPPPAGYRSRKGSRQLHVDDRSAPLVRRTFAIKDANPSLSARAIARQLRAEGFTGARGGRIEAVQVISILRHRPFYQGRYAYAGITAKGQHASLI